MTRLRWGSHGALRKGSFASHGRQARQWLWGGCILRAMIHTRIRGDSLKQVREASSCVRNHLWGQLLRHSRRPRIERGSCRKGSPSHLPRELHSPLLAAGRGSRRGEDWRISAVEFGGWRGS
eukprot:scaffold47281_cov31-Tisochrysis_lutea.AAC.1